VTNAFFGYIRAAILLAAFASATGAAGGASRGTTIAGYDVPSAVTYTWITQALIMIVMMWGWWDVEETIRSGDVVSDLSRPFSYLGYWLARDVGRAAYFVLFRAAPVMLVGQVLFGLRWPSSPLVWAAFAASTGLAIVISFAWRFLINLTAFWTTDARGIGAVAFAAVYFLSGLVIPLRFFPDWARGAALALPFAGILQTPADVFLERTAGAELAWPLGLQAFWALVLLGAAHLAVAAATRRVVIQGG
jgi:ABC-2 type transport system permease protein